MNPYNFVHINWQAGVTRQKPHSHDRFEGVSGRIEGEIKTLTPLFIPKSKGQPGNLAREFITNGQRQTIIPGTTLKGLMRGLVETIGAGCWWLRGKSHQHQLPAPFHQCENKNNLCIACRMFGLIKGGTLLLGHVGFEDAICLQPKPHEAIYTIILSGPKDRHTAFYLDPSQRQLAGRKFYYHSPTIRTARSWLPTHNVSADRRQNQYIKPIGAESIFTFSAHFNNLTSAELQLLLYALVLEPTMRHKIGQAKPAGLGSVEISLTQLELIDYSQRYRLPSGGKMVYTGDSLKTYLTTQTQPYTSNQTSNTLNDLRSIWAWPGRDDLSYPTQDWFKKNPQARIDLSIPSNQIDWINEVVNIDLEKKN